MQNLKLAENPLKTKADIAKALNEILRPLEKHFDSSVYGIKFDSSAAGYAEKTMEIEALLRPLWGIFPLLAGGGDYAFFDKYIEKIVKGTDPDSQSYWGKLPFSDQRMVEMAVLGLGLMIAKDKFWNILPSSQQENLYNWLSQINMHDMPVNNWRFFRILVNLGLKNCGQPHDAKRMREDLQLMESFYMDNGWYFDGGRDQIDYYIPWGMQFYGIVYSAMCPNDEYSLRFIERAKMFAPSFAAFFADDGSAVPFGRSLTYRFCQSSFWGALAFANIEALPWGQIKYLALQNLRHWFKQEIFSTSGELTIGYYYRNQIMAEGYNAFGSPYWALKAFIILALPEDHPFWASEEEKPDAPNHLPVSDARCIIQRDKNQVQLYSVGQHIGFNIVHGQHKYEKFVYSSHFGFSVPRSTAGLSQGAFDNTIAVSEDDEFWRTRNGVSSFKVFDDRLFSRWQPWKNVTIDTYIIPLFPWHIRLHIVETERSIVLADGGFAISAIDECENQNGDVFCAVLKQTELSGIVSLLAWQKPEIVQPESSTNLMAKKTRIPTLLSKLLPRKHILASAVLGAKGNDVQEAWKLVPKIDIKDGKYLVSDFDATRKVEFEAKFSQ